MKTINLLKIAFVILLGIAINGTAQAEKDKHSRYAGHALRQISHSVMLISEEIRNMKTIFEQPVEDWMFESDYLSEESAGTVESWMLEADYLNEGVQPLESWMFRESWLAETVSENPV
jgi:hypothetical protein